MPFDPNQPRDKSGEWSKTLSIATPKLRVGVDKVKTAIEWVRSPEGRQSVANSAITAALQSALFHMAHVEQPIADELIEQQVKLLAHARGVTAATARNTLIALITRVIVARKKL